MRLGYGSAGASRNVSAFHARAAGQRSQFFVGILRRDVGLSLVGLGNELPKCLVRRLRNAISVSGSLRCPVVHLQGETLEDKTLVRFRRNQSLDGGLRRFAGRALQIAELDNRDRRILWPARRSSHSLLQCFPRWIERLGAEGNNIADHGVVAVRRHVEPAELLALWGGDNDVDLSQTGHWRRCYAGDLPTQLRLIAEGLLHEGVDRGF